MSASLAHSSSQSQRRQTIAVVGLGSIGGVAAGCLIAVGRHDVIACLRQRMAQLTLERPQGAAMIATDVPLRTLTDPAQAEAADWVLLCTKTHQTAAAAPWLKRLCAPGTHVAVLQNGIDQVVRVAPLVPDAAVMPVIVYYNSERLAPDRVRLRQGSDQDLAAADDDNGRAFAQLLEGTPLRILLAKDFATLAWRKLLINAVANPITALTLQRQAVLRRDDIQELGRVILEEAVAVARAFATLFTFSGELGTSMYFDRLAGRQLEIEALTGVIVEKGKRHGVATPVNGALLALLRAVNDAAGRGQAA
jgi:2-dehydropantoate 2-reductase